MSYYPHEEHGYYSSNSSDESAKYEDILGHDNLPIWMRRAGRYVAIDCEFVGVGPRGARSALGRVSIVNWHGHCLYDTYVRPSERVTKYRTWVSGITKKDLINAPSFEEVQNNVLEWIIGRIVVGHSLKCDLTALQINMPQESMRDIATWQPFRDDYGNPTPSLRKLAGGVLNVLIQARGQPHDSVEDARATMALYRTVHESWKRQLRYD